MRNIFKKVTTVLMTLLLFLSNGTVSVNAEVGSPELNELEVVIKQNGTTIEEGDVIDSASTIDLSFSFLIPVLGDTYNTGHEEDPYFQKGDSTDFNVSTGFTVGSGGAGPFKLESGGSVIGYLELITDSITGAVTAHVVFQDDLANGIIVSDEVFDGTIHDVSVIFNTSLEFDDSGASGEVGNHDVILLDTTYTVNVAPAPIIVNTIKNGVRNEKVIDWTVTYNITQDLINISLADYIFEDDLSDAGTYAVGSFEVNSVGVPIANDDPLLDLTSISYDLSSLTSPITISYRTELDDDEYFSGDNKTFTNTSSLTKDSELVVDSSATASVDLIKNWITKSGLLQDGYIYTNEDPVEPSATMIWTIEANNLGADIDNVIITDYLSSHLAITDAQLYVGDSATGNPITYTSGGLNPEGTIETIIFDLGSITEKIKIILTTDVIWTASSFDFGHNIYTINNSADISWSYNSGAGIGTSGVGDIGVNVGTNPISKSVISSDKSNQLINWEITVTQSNVSKDLRVIDLLVYGDTFNTNIDDTPVDLPTDIFDDENDELTKFNLVKHISNVTPSFGQEYYNEGNSNITLRTIYNAAGTAIADLLVFTEAGLGIDVSTSPKPFQFSSRLTNPAVYASNKQNTRIYNSATLFNRYIKLNKKTIYYDYDSTMIVKDMLTVDNAENLVFDSIKSGVDKAFNYVDKTIVFRLTVNSNGLDSTNSYTDLENIVVTDVLPTGWNLININSDGDKFLMYEFDGTDVTDSSVDTTSGFLVTDFSDTTKPTFNFSELDKTYVILIKAQLDNDIAIDYLKDNEDTNISNTAIFSADSLAINSVSSTQNITIPSEIVSKGYSIPSEGELLWNIEYKPYGLNYNGVEINDTLPEGLDIRTNSLGELDLTAGNFSIIELNLNNYGTYSPGDVVLLEVGTNIEYDSNTKTLTFKIIDPAKGYQFKYITDITADSGVELTNSVSLLNGDFDSVAAGGSYTVASYDVLATLRRSGSVKITKLNSESGTLPGARFGLYSEDGSTLIRSGYTASNGEVFLRGLPDGNYQLKEIEAPVSYKKSTKVYSVVVTTTDGVVTTSINGQTGEESNSITYINFQTGTTGDLKVSKALTGSAPDYTKDFEFTIEIADLNESFDYIGSGGKANASITFVNGKASFTLRGGESILIQYLPIDLAYTISEKDYYGDPADRYSTTSINDTGVIIVDDTVYVQFTNQKHALIYEDYGTLPDTGDDFPTNLLISLLAVSFLGVIVLLFIKKKKFGN